jgi:hypothetical protein
VASVVEYINGRIPSLYKLSGFVKLTMENLLKGKTAKKKKKKKMNFSSTIFPNSQQIAKVSRVENGSVFDGEF